MNDEREGYLTAAMKNGVCWARFYSDHYDDEDLCRALKFLGLHPPNFKFEVDRVRLSDKPLTEKTPIKGAVGDVWIVEGSIRKDGDGPVGQPK